MTQSFSYYLIDGRSNSHLHTGNADNMSKKFKTQASSGRAAGGFGAFSNSAFASGHSSTLSYIQETPDYSGVSDSNVVVAFKNLSKKDGTTKAKALEDLSTYVTLNNKEIEESVLEAWVGLTVT